jgi:hypothetical protein
VSNGLRNGYKAFVKPENIFVSQSVLHISLFFTFITCRQKLFVAVIITLHMQCIDPQICLHVFIMSKVDSNETCTP